ncbi:MAG: histidine kinase [Methylobacter sp.]|nr:MAG: histidine kinase [Methylobacter sp.]PPD31979.1 MAG: histidine kinase [Methylomonas sp.]
MTHPFDYKTSVFTGMVKKLALRFCFLLIAAHLFNFEACAAGHRAAMFIPETSDFRTRFAVFSQSAAEAVGGALFPHNRYRYWIDGVIPDDRAAEIRPTSELINAAQQNGAKEANINFTAEERRWIQEHPVIRYGAEADWPPYDFIDKAGQHTGLSRDLLVLISKYSGLNFSPEIAAWDDLLKKAQAGEIDLLPALFETKERQSYLNFTQAYQQALDYFFIRDDVQAQTLDDLDGKTIAITEGYAQIDEIKKRYPKIKILETDGMMSSVQAVIERKADIVSEVYSVMNYLLKQNGITTIRPFKALPSGEAKQIKMAIRKDLPILFSILQKTLSAIPLKEKQELNDKWLGYAPAQTQDAIALTEAEKNWLAEHPVIRFTSASDWLPYGDFDSNNRFIGIAADYLKLLESKLPIKFDIAASRSRDESRTKLIQQEADMLSETIATDIQSQFIFSEAFISAPIVILMRDKEGYVENIEQIKERRIAVVKDFSPLVESRYPTLHTIKVNTLREGLTAVSSGKADALLATLGPASYYLENLGINNVRIVGKTEFINQLGFGLRPEFAPLLPLLNRTLNRISETEKQQIRDKWGKDRFVTKTDYGLIAKILSAVLFLYLLTLLWIRTVQRQQAKLRMSEERFKMAMSATSDGLWDWNAQTNKVYFNPRWMTMLGYEAQELPHTFETFEKLLHPDERDDVLAKNKKMLDEFGFDYEEVFRLRCKDGTYRWILSRGRVFQRDNHGKALRAVGTHVDITDRKQADEQFKTLVNALPISIAVVDSEGNILLHNPELARTVGKTGDISNQNLLTFITNTNQFESIRQTVSASESFFSRQICLKKDSEHDIDCLLSIIPRSFQGKLSSLVVIVDLSERIKIEKDLARAKAAAEQANQLKSAFLANMSHEIRTPLNSIIGFTELLSNHIKDPKLSSFVKTIQSAGYSLLNLINDILDLSKIEAGKMTIKKNACNPHDMFDEIGQIFMMEIKAKNLDFILDVDPNIPENLLLDETRLRQVLLNLIGNAVKFTHQGHICVRARAGNENKIYSKVDLYIDVEDTGIGIPEDQQQRIFSDFEQMEGQNPHQYGGTGLGLAISKRLTKLMDGEISVVSTPNVGSTFTLHLMDVSISSIRFQPESDKTTPATQIRFFPANVLVVDDVEDNRGLLRECFADTELTIIEAENGQDAIDKAKQNRIDLIFMDIRMPLIDGYLAAAEIKNFSNTPIVALTASVMKDESERIKSTDFDGYLRKPVLKNELLKELTRFLAYEETLACNIPEHTIALSTEKIQVLPELVHALEKLLPVCEKISRTNNLSEIKKFAEKLLAIGQQFDIAFIVDYALQLEADLDCLDILAIKKTLETFPRFVSDFSNLLEKT